MKKQHFELAIKSSNWKWNIHYLTNHPHPKWHLNPCLPLNSVGFPVTKSLPPKICYLWHSWRDRHYLIFFILSLAKAKQITVNLTPQEEE